jgi:hypothetical protein
MIYYNDYFCTAKGINNDNKTKDRLVKGKGLKINLS